MNSCSPEVKRVRLIHPVNIAQDSGFQTFGCSFHSASLDKDHERVRHSHHVFPKLSGCNHDADNRTMFMYDSTCLVPRRPCTAHIVAPYSLGGISLDRALSRMEQLVLLLEGVLVYSAHHKHPFLLLVHTSTNNTPD